MNTKFHAITRVRWNYKDMDMYILKTNYGFMNTNFHAIPRVDKYDMELGFSEQFTSYEMELEIENQLGLTNNEMELGFSEQFTS